MYIHLHRQFGDHKQNFVSTLFQLKDLQEEMETLRKREALESLEQENAQLTEERDSLHKDLTAMQAHVNSLQSDYEVLQSQCKC